MRFSGVFLHVFLIATGFIMVAPFLWMVSTALKGPAEIFVYPPRWLPEEIHLENFARAWQAAPFGRFYLNSIVVTLIITISQVATASLAAYVFARLNFPGRDMIFYLYVATLIIPIQVTIIPLYLILNALGC
jgi:multiple sugar transport system permease protein